VFARLPRRPVSALAADGARLYAAQWGGWSEWDGRTWAHHLRLGELQGEPLTLLHPDGDILWIGTQKRGVAAATRGADRAVTLDWSDERAGLPDDWITAMARAGGTLFAGTFVGGLARRVGPRWQPSPTLRGQNVTSLASDAEGGLFVATRAGVFHLARDGALIPLGRVVRYLDPEAQALCPTPRGLWIGARTGLFFVPGPVTSGA
jgi:ligand-binding sensor domain-containing protein